MIQLYLRQSFIYNHAQNYTGLTEVECEENDLHQGADFLKTNSTSLLQARHRVVVLNEGNLRRKKMVACL